MEPLPALSFASMSVHIGEEIERRRVATGMSKTELANRMGVDRTNIYDMIQAPSIDTLKLKLCCEALGTNFFRMLSDDQDRDMGMVRTSTVEEPMVVYGRRPAERRSPLRLVIEVDPDDENAQKAAMDMAEQMKGRMKGPVPVRDKGGR